MIQKRISTLLSFALMLALVIEPVALTLHEMHHIVRGGAAEFVAHDEAEHAHHVPIDQHHVCGLCVHTKCTDAAVAAIPSGVCVGHDLGPAFFIEQHAPSTRDASAASSRAPPLAS